MLRNHSPRITLSPAAAPADGVDAAMPLPFVASFRHYTLASHFQPVFSLVHQRAVGHEALLRAYAGTADDGRTVPPLSVFAESEQHGDELQLDAACHRLHMANGRALRGEREWLFMNVRPQAFLIADYPRRLAARVRETGMRTQQIVLEVLETGGCPIADLAKAVDAFRGEGFVIALDDFGAGHSNIDRVVNLAPDIVKLDRCLIAQAHRPAIARMLPNLVALLHEAGTMVLAEGVETQDDVNRVVDWGADLAQGYFLGLPQPARQIDAPAVARIRDAYDSMSHKRALRESGLRTRLRDYEAAVLDAAAQLSAGKPFDACCEKLVALPYCSRCYLIDARGAQIGATIDGAATPQLDVDRFAPLMDPSGGRWGNRPYFSKALNASGGLVVTQPYLSITGAHNCVTLAVAVDIDGVLSVFGVDVAWD